MTVQGPEFTVTGTPGAPDFITGAAKAAFWSIARNGRPWQTCLSTGWETMRRLVSHLTGVDPNVQPGPASEGLKANTLAALWRLGQLVGMDENANPMRAIRIARDHEVGGPLRTVELTQADLLAITAFAVWGAFYARTDAQTTILPADILVRNDANPLPIGYAPDDDQGIGRDLVCYEALEDGSPNIGGAPVAPSGVAPPRMVAAQRRGTKLLYGAAALGAALTAAAAKARRRRR